MRVALVIDSFPPYISGITTHYLTLARELTRKGHKVMIIAPKSGYPQIPKGLEKCKIEFIPSIPIGVAKNMRLGTPSTLKTLLRFAKFKAEIIEVCGPTFLGIDALIASKILEAPCVSYFYTLLTSKEFLQLIALVGKTKALQKASWLYNRWFYNSSDTIFVPSKGVAKILTKNHINKKIVVAPVFTDLRESKTISDKQKVALKKKYKLKKNVALYLGRLSKEKNLDMLLEIWRIVVNDLPDSTLLIIGDGKHKNSLVKKAHALDLDDNVVFTGEFKHDELMTSGIIKTCDLYVSASISETFGIAGLEAMINGLPVVLSKSQGLCEFVDGAGFICKLDNKKQFSNSIKRILKDKRLQQKMSNRSKIVAAKFDNKIGIKNIVNIYDRIIKDYEANPNKKSPFKLF